LTRLSSRLLRKNRILFLPLALGFVLVLWPARPLRSDNFVFYLPRARHVVPLETFENAKYLPLLQVLNLMGKVAGIQEKKNALRVWFGNSTLDVRLNEKRVGVDKVTIDLAQPVRMSNGQWWVPVDFLTSALPRLTHQVVEYQVGTNRIFIGDVKPGSFTVRLDDVASGARLTIQFTDRVAVRTASRDGKWVLYLGENAIEPLEQTYQFKDPYVSELRFDDQDGVPKLILTPSTSGLNFYPAMAEGGKILLADVLKPPPTVAAQTSPGSQPAAPPSPPPASAGPEQPQVTGEVPAAQPGPPLPVVVLDPGHGAEDTGARSRDGVLEKDLVAQLVARVRLALLATQKFRIVLTRTGDVNPSFEQRELAANVARAAFFVSFHAGDLGAGTPRVGVYTYQPSAPAALGGAPALPAFLPWAEVQQTHVGQSRQLALALQQQLGGIPGTRIEPPTSAPLRGLRSINAPAVAVEIGSLVPDEDAGALSNPDFLEQIAAAVAKTLASLGGGGA